MNYSVCNKDCFHCQYADCICGDDDYTDVENVDKTLQVYINWQRNTHQENKDSKSLKERQKRYEQTSKGKDRQKRYNQSEKGKLRWKKYYQAKKQRMARC